MMNGVIEGLAPEVIIADRFYDFDRKLFGVEEMPPEEIRAHALSVAQKIAAQEMVRVLKPTGKLVITDLDEHGFEFLRLEQQDLWLGFKQEDIHRWFAEARLRNITVGCVGENCCAESSRGRESARVSIFVASGEK